MFRNLFGDKIETVKWRTAVVTLSNKIWELLHDQPEVLVSPCTRVVLKRDGSVGIAIDKRHADESLGVDDLASVFLQEHPVAVKHWLDGLRKSVNPEYQQDRTKDFAEFLVQALMHLVNQELRGPWLRQADYERRQRYA
jgi:hypothetical protein